MPRGWHAPGTGELIKAYLLAKGREGGSPFSINRFVRRYLTAFYGGRNYVPPTYDSIRVMIRDLLRLGLIEKARTEFTPPQLFQATRAGEVVASARTREGLSERLADLGIPLSSVTIQTRTLGIRPRTYYRIRQGMEDDPRWRDVKKALFRPSDFDAIRDLPRFQLSPQQKEEIRIFVLENKL